MSLRFIIGPCAIESPDVSIASALFIKDIQDYINDKYQEDFVEIVFKSCYNKANRTELDSFHGIGIEAGLDILREVKRLTGLKVTSDVHTVEEIEKAKDVLDIIQIPQSLSRYTNIIAAAAMTGKQVSIKKGVFMNMKELKAAHLKTKAYANNNLPVILIERGTKVGSEDTVVDFLNLKKMREISGVACIDASHSAPKREDVVDIARLGIAAQANMVFIEAHPFPDQALCDGKTSLALDHKLYETILEICLRYRMDIRW